MNYEVVNPDDTIELYCKQVQAKYLEVESACIPDIV